MKMLDTLGWDERNVVAVIILLTASTYLLFGFYAILVPILSFISIVYFYERKKQRIEEELPRWVHTAATYPSITPKALISLGRKGFGELSKELESVERMVEKGIPPLRALRTLYERWDSSLIERAITSIIEAFRAGTAPQLLKNLSEELYVVGETEREKLSTLSLQRYSILLSSFLLVPIVLGFVTKLVERMGGSIGEVVLVYLLLLVSISGFFVGALERKPKNIPVYILVGSLVAMGVYMVIVWYS